MAIEISPDTGKTILNTKEDFVSYIEETFGLIQTWLQNNPEEKDFNDIQKKAGRENLANIQVKITRILDLIQKNKVPPEIGDRLDILNEKPVMSLDDFSPGYLNEINKELQDIYGRFLELSSNFKNRYYDWDSKQLNQIKAEQKSLFSSFRAVVKNLF